MSEFPPGFAVIYDGQRYEFSGARSYQRKDNIPATLLDWNTQCPDCGKPFSITTPLVFKEPTRRCSGCRRPGAAVRTRMRRRTSPAVERKQ